MPYERESPKSRCGAGTWRRPADPECCGPPLIEGCPAVFRAKLSGMDIAAFVVSVLALLASAYAVVYARQSAKADASMAEIEGDRRAEEVADRERAEETSMRAELSVEATAPEQNTNPGLVVTNNGGGVARDVIVRADGPGIAPDAMALKRGRLEPGDRWHIESVGTPNRRGRVAEVEVTWLDRSGGGRVEAQIRFE